MQLLTKPLVTQLSLRLWSHIQLHRQNTPSESFLWFKLSKIHRKWVWHSHGSHEDIPAPVVLFPIRNGNSHCWGWTHGKMLRVVSWHVLLSLSSFTGLAKCFLEDTIEKADEKGSKCLGRLKLWKAGFPQHSLKCRHLKSKHFLWMPAQVELFKWSQQLN